MSTDEQIAALTDRCSHLESRMKLAEEVQFQQQDQIGVIIGLIQRQKDNIEQISKILITLTNPRMIPGAPIGAQPPSIILPGR